MSRDEQAIEAELQAKGLTAKRITPAMLDAEIAAEDYHVFPGSCLTVCCLTMKNGFTVTGESACASPENFNAEIGQKIARTTPAKSCGRFLDSACAARWLSLAW